MNDSAITGAEVREIADSYGVPHHRGVALAVKLERATAEGDPLVWDPERPGVVA